ncbi:Fis family transcriptional regulator [Caballeronia arationis]|nr:Fis family transcriptional regulator [Caballeronia arationis]
MPVSKNRKKRASSSCATHRHKKQLYLPMSRTDVDEISLQFQLDFECIRQGRGDRRAALNMTSIALLVEFLTEAGYGGLSIELLRSVQERLSELLDHGVTTNEWKCSGTLVDELNEVVNEYDRQLRETRLQAIVAATQRLEKLIASTPDKLTSLRRICARL